MVTSCTADGCESSVAKCFLAGVSRRELTRVERLVRTVRVVEQKEKELLVPVVGVVERRVAAAALVVAIHHNQKQSFWVI